MADPGVRVRSDVRSALSFGRPVAGDSASFVARLLAGTTRYDHVTLAISSTRGEVVAPVAQSPLIGGISLNRALYFKCNIRTLLFRVHL